MKIVLKGGNNREIAAKGYIVPVLSGVMIAVGAAYPVITLACFAMNLIYIFAVSAKETYRLLFMLLPFTQVYKAAVIGTVSLFTVLELFAVIILFLKQKRVNGRFLALLIMWALYVLLGSRMDILQWIKQLMVPLLIYLFFKNEQLDIKELVISLSIGLILSSIIAQYKDMIPNLADMMRITRLWEAEGVVYRFSGLYPDPNYYTAWIIICSVSLLTMYACRTMGWQALALFAVLNTFGVQTGSKSYLLMLCIILCMFVGILFLTKRNTLGLLALAVIALFCIAVFSGRIQMFQNILIRLRTDHNATGRVDLWLRYIKYLNENWLCWICGRGISAPDLNGVAHNTYLDFPYYYGVVGTLLWLTTCMNAIGKIRIPSLYISCLPMVCLLALSMFLSYVLFYDFAFAIIFAVYALKADFRKAFAVDRVMLKEVHV